MATTRGVNNTNAQQGPSFVPISGGDGGGKRVTIYDERVLTAADVQNGIIVMGTDKALKKGDRVLGMALWWNALGASVTLAVGDDGSAARYLAATAANAANTAPQNLATVAAMGYVLTQDRDLLITIGGANPTVGQTIKLAFDVMRA